MRIALAARSELFEIARKIWYPPLEVVTAFPELGRYGENGNFPKGRDRVSLSNMMGKTYEGVKESADGDCLPRRPTLFLFRSILGDHGNQSQWLV